MRGLDDLQIKSSLILRKEINRAYKRKCIDCDGKGFVIRKEKQENGQELDKSEACDSCEGTGSRD